MTDAKKTENSAEDNSVFATQVAGLLDFYSDRATAHASLFVASIFGLVSVLAIIQSFILSEQPVDRCIIWISEGLFFIFTYMGHYTLNQFNYYANLSQRMTDGLNAKKTLLRIKVDAKEKNLYDYQVSREKEQRLILVPKGIVKKLGSCGGFFMVIVYWIIVFVLGLTVYLPFFESESDTILWVSLFIIQVLIFAALPAFCALYVRKKSYKKGQENDLSNGNAVQSKN